MWSVLYRYCVWKNICLLASVKLSGKQWAISKPPFPFLQPFHALLFLSPAYMHHAGNSLKDNRPIAVMRNGYNDQMAVCFLLGNLWPWVWHKLVVKVHFYGRNLKIPHVWTIYESSFFLYVCWLICVYLYL